MKQIFVWKQEQKIVLDLYTFRGLIWSIYIRMIQICMKLKYHGIFLQNSNFEYLLQRKSFMKVSFFFSFSFNPS